MKDLIPQRTDRAALGTWVLASLAAAWLSIVVIRVIPHQGDWPDYLTRWNQWDADRFWWLATYGYDGGPPGRYETFSWPAFFPGYPLVIRLVGIVVPDYRAAGLLISFLAGPLAAVALSRLAALPASGLRLPSRPAPGSRPAPSPRPVVSGPSEPPGSAEEDRASAPEGLVSHASSPLAERVNGRNQVVHRVSPPADLDRSDLSADSGLSTESEDHGPAAPDGASSPGAASPFEKTSSHGVASSSETAPAQARLVSSPERVSPRGAASSTEAGSPAGVATWPGTDHPAGSGTGPGPITRDGSGALDGPWPQNGSSALAREDSVEDSPGRSKARTEALEGQETPEGSGKWRSPGFYAVLALVTSPCAVFLFAAYSEALFLALAVPAWLLAKKGRWELAVLCAAAASIVRITGLFLALGLIVEFLVGQNGRKAPGGWRNAPYLITPFLSIGAYMGYQWYRTGDPMAWQHAQEQGWNRHLVMPWEAFKTTWYNAFDIDTEWSNAFRVEIAAATVGVLLVLWLIHQRKWPETVYISTQLAAFMTSSFYLSIGRATLLWFPLWIALGHLMYRHRWFTGLYLALSLPLAAAFIASFTQGQWTG